MNQSQTKILLITTNITSCIITLIIWVLTTKINLTTQFCTTNDSFPAAARPRTKFLTVTLYEGDKVSF